MKTKKKAIEAIKSLMSEHKDIHLDVGGGCVSWKSRVDFNKEKSNLVEVNSSLSHEEWKHIGYVSALRWAFDITESDI